MSKAIAYSRDLYTIAQNRQLELLRSAIVLGCGAALILAGKPLPL